MKKVLFSILFLIPALWAGATWYTSQNTESVLDEMLTQTNQQMFEEAPFLHIEKKSFEKGFTQSLAQSTITVDPIFSSEKDAQPIQFNLNHKIYHGPLMMTPNGIKTGSSYILTTLDQTSLPEKVKSTLTSLFGDKEPFVSSVTTGTGEMVDTELTVAPFSINAAQVAALTGKNLEGKELAFSFAGISGNFTSNIEGSQVKGEMKLGEMEMKGGDSSGGNFIITMAASTVDMDVDDLYKGSILDGKVIVTIPNFLFSDGKGTDVAFNGIAIIASAEQEKDLMNVMTSLDINTMQLKLANAKFNFPDSKVQMRSSFNGVERAAAIKLVDMEQELQRSQMKVISSLKSGDDIKVVHDEIMPSVLAYYRASADMIKQGVNIKSALEINNKTGNAAINLDLSYIDTKQLLSLKTVKELAAALQGQLTINIDKGLLTGTRLEKAIALPVEMGFAVEKGDRYESIASLNNGELRLNEQPVPFLEMVADKPLAWDEMFKSSGMKDFRELNRSPLN